MIFSIPIFIEERSSGPGISPTFVVRPLFQREPVQRAEKLTRALAKLSNNLHQLLLGLGRSPRHDDLAAWTFDPLLDETTIELRLELKSGSHRRLFFLVGYSSFGRKLYFCPKLPELHFEVLSNQTLADRAVTVFTPHFREMERDRGAVDLDDFALIGKGRLTILEVALDPASLATKKSGTTRAALFGGQEKKEGEVELRRTGRRLNSMYPDDLERAFYRDHEVEELDRLLVADDRRPVLLVGPRRVGKTTVLHELVRRICARRKGGSGDGPDVWLVSPMRLISGMSYLGEWENRVLAILEHAREKDLVLYFDDLLGLFSAGVSSASDLNVAQVLRPWLERRSVRLVAEIAPEAWRKLQERDRAFADLFHLIPVEEPSDAETLRILIHVDRSLEEAHRCAFDLEVVPASCDLVRRFGTDAAFPGKAADFLKRLAARHSGQPVTRADALEEFQQQSGLRVAMLDGSVKLERSSLLEQLRTRVVGQDNALEAFADILVTLKARLNDPRRPLGTLLLLGPTGVGKTQAANALAELLFGGKERLLRFDMNEYVDASSVLRLTGSPMEPEGLLTSAVRRQPFSVVLFDEIEKASPELFDLLLAVLDEGRLTDSLGRVTDFTQTVILMTSNLGARESRARLGFGVGSAGSAADDTAYISAAEKFFRPEFFNRLDRVVPFRTLDATHLERICGLLIGNLLTRDGLRRRDGVLTVAPAAIQRLVGLGNHPQLGARALKRVIEREVAQPLAELLVALPPGTAMMALLAAKETGFAVSLRSLNPVDRSVTWPETLGPASPLASDPNWTVKVLDGVRRALRRIETELGKNAPAGTIELAALPAHHVRYFLGRESIVNVLQLIKDVEDAQVMAGRPKRASKLPRARTLRPERLFDSPSGTFLHRLRDVFAVRHSLEDLEADVVELPDSPLAALLREVALLEALAQAPMDGEKEVLLLTFRTLLAKDNDLMHRLVRLHVEALGSIWGASKLVSVESLGEKNLGGSGNLSEPQGRSMAIRIVGHDARRFLPEGPNLILIKRADGGTGVILTSLETLAADSNGGAQCQQLSPSVDDMDVHSLGPVIQRVVENQGMTDFRSGVTVPDRPSDDEFRSLLLSMLPLPPEVAVSLSRES
ncbi:MAG: ATP-dependent Clp protease ATP-binding subunit [Verrucomicrobiales bacterium]|nr:ATP-dependent Clp protease ATP-binding subunit [Verrucomicrobiales bacterium]